MIKQIANNQFILRERGKDTFYSYESKIATLDNERNKIILFDDFNYSRTTNKYFKKFYDENKSYKMPTSETIHKIYKQLNETNKKIFKSDDFTIQIARG